MASMSKKEIEKAYNAIADEFEKKRKFPWRKVEKFAEKIAPGSSVLDIGCGAGRHMKIMEGKGMLLAGLDISQELIKRAKKRTGAFFVKGDAARLPFRSNSFDFVMNIAVLHHIPSQKERLESLMEIRRVMRKKAIISVWAHEEKRFQGMEKDVIIPWKRNDGVSVPRYYHLFDRREFKSLIEKSGLFIEEYCREKGNHFAVVSKRII